MSTPSIQNVIYDIIEGAKNVGNAVAPIIGGAIKQIKEVADTPQAQAAWNNAYEFAYNNKLTVCLPAADATAAYFAPHLFHNKYAYIGSAVVGQLMDHWDFYKFYLEKAYTATADAGCTIVPSLPWCNALENLLARDTSEITLQQYAAEEL